MKTIIKSEAASCLKIAKDNGWNWDEFHKNDQSGYKDCLTQGLNEQNNECAYTGLWLGEGPKIIRQIRNLHGCDTADIKEWMKNSGFSFVVDFELANFEKNYTYMNMKEIFMKLAEAVRPITLIIIACLGIPISAQSPEEETVAIVNKWAEGDCAYYRTYSGRIRIEGSDTIHEREDPETMTKVLLAAVLEDDDKVFVMTTQQTDSARLVKEIAEQPLFSVTVNGETEQEDTASTAKDKAEIYGYFLKLMETPVTILTDFSGELKDIYDYESLRAEMDSCFEKVTDMIEEKNLPDETKLSLLLNMRQIWDQAVSKESLMERCDLFRYYGYNYPLGSSVETRKLPIFGDEYLVDATVTFSCEVLESESGNEYIEITSLISYDADQMMDSLLSSTVKEQAHLNREPDRPVATVTMTETFLFEPTKGTIVEYTQERRTSSDGKTIIEYRVKELE